MEYSIHVVDGISMEDPNGPAPAPPQLNEFIDTIDALTRRALFEAAAQEDNKDA